MPIGRFDIDLYYDDGLSEQFNASGKSSTCHCGLIGDDELVAFDNVFFGIEDRDAKVIPPIQRVLMEVSAETLFRVGYTMQSMRNERVYLAIADIGIEWDPFTCYCQDPTAWLRSGMNTVLSVNRLANAFGLVGPAHQVDTACSASLVAANMAHAYLRKDAKEVQQAMSMGQQQIVQPWPFIGLSSAGMLGRGGRCKTFDQSANGYNRGEGCGGLFQKVGRSADDVLERLACYVGSYINQDGRSASLTAPNGPSQQAVVRGSLGQGEINAEWVACTENHGTGTALGDPIEVGTIKAVFRRRETLLPITSAKTNMGHLECGAGSVGIIRTVLSLANGGVPANCHLRMPNPHCETEGMPAMFPIEICDMATESHYGGCNGFGFGGTNTRADFWAVRRNGVHRFAEPRRQVVVGEGMFGSILPRLSEMDMITVTCSLCSSPMCWLCGEAYSSPTKHHCTSIRADLSSFDVCSRCYVGSYIVAATLKKMRPCRPRPCICKARGTASLP